MNRTTHKIKYGDKIFARLTLGHRVIAEFMMNRVSDFSELIAELRHSTQGLRGLATLHVRNQSEGWSEQRPLMLYAGTHHTRPVAQSLFDVQPAARDYSLQQVLGHYNL